MGERSNETIGESSRKNGSLPCSSKSLARRNSRSGIAATLPLLWSTIGCSPQPSAFVAPDASRPNSPADAAQDDGGIESSPWVPSGYQLAFADEFDTETFELDLDGNGSTNWAPYWLSWNVRHLEGNNDQALKADRSYFGTGGEPLGLDIHQNTDDTLMLRGYPLPEERRAQFHDFPYVAGMISGERSHQQQYGYWEIRMRFATTSIGHHWAVWLLSSDASWPPELDLIEVVGQHPHMFSVNAIDADAVGNPTGSLTFRDFPRAIDDFYTLGLLWTASEIVFSLDGDEIQRTPNFIDKPMYLLVSPEIGGNWPGEPDATTTWPMEASIDYVRVYRAEAK